MLLWDAVIFDCHQAAEIFSVHYEIMIDSSWPPTDWIPHDMTILTSYPMSAIPTPTPGDVTYIRVRSIDAAGNTSDDNCPDI